ERGSEQLLGIPPARVAPEGRVGTARDGLRPAGVPVLVPADRHLMITAVLPVSAGAAAPVAGPGDSDVITVGSDHAGPPRLPDASLPPGRRDHHARRRQRDLPRSYPKAPLACDA